MLRVEKRQEKCGRNVEKNGQYLVLGNTFFDTKILTGIFYRLGTN